MTRAVRQLVALALLAMLAGCMHMKPVVGGWSADDMARVTRFDIQAKVGFRRGEHGGSAALLWQQDNERYRLVASGPLGAGGVRIDGNAGQVRIATADGVRESSDPATLLAEAIGWPVSVNSLSYWVRGLAAPRAEGEAAAVIISDDQGRPIHIRQQGWDIVLDRWQADGRRMLPHKVVATGGDSRVTLLIQHWTTPAPGAH